MSHSHKAAHLWIEQEREVHLLLAVPPIGDTNNGTILHLCSLGVSAFRLRFVWDVLHKKAPIWAAGELLSNLWLFTPAQFMGWSEETIQCLLSGLNNPIPSLYCQGHSPQMMDSLPWQNAVKSHFIHFIWVVQLILQITWHRLRWCHSQRKRVQQCSFNTYPDYNAFIRSPKGLDGWINHKHAFLSKKMYCSPTGGVGVKKD